MHFHIDLSQITYFRLNAKKHHTDYDQAQNDGHSAPLIFVLEETHMSFYYQSNAI